MFLRVTLIVVCVLGLLTVIVPKQKEQPRNTKTTSTISAKNDGPRETIKKISSTRSNIEKRLAEVKVPAKMLKNGEIQKLSQEQKRNYAILAAFFKNDPIMVKIAACESSLLHTLPNGRVNVSRDGYDVGTFQVRLPVHGGELVRHGLDPTDFAHNVAYATHIYRKDGLRHWNSSRSCWETLRFLV